jgi:metal-sulfur cluster biosynthetic enzyme
VLATVLLVGLGVVITLLPSLIRGGRSHRLTVNPFAPLADSGRVPLDTLGLDSTRVMAALEQVDDPELDLSIVELGLVHTLRVDSARNVAIVLALTTPECPYGLNLAYATLEAVKLVPGARRISVRLDPDLPWDPARLSGRARGRYDSLFGPNAPTHR